MSALPPSPPLPHSRCNWLMPGLLVGAVPTRESLPDLLKLGISLFVCLADIDAGWYRCGLPAGVDYLNLNIKGGGVPSATDANSLVSTILTQLDKGVLVYLHCNGGHGRAGMVGALIVGRKYRLQAAAAIRMVEESRETRRDTSRNYIPTPETCQQVRFVGHILGVDPDDPLPDRSDMRWLARVKRERRLKAGSAARLI